MNAAEQSVDILLQIIKAIRRLKQGMRVKNSDDTLADVYLGNNLTPLFFDESEEMVRGVGRVAKVRLSAWDESDIGEHEAYLGEETVDGMRITLRTTQAGLDSMLARFPA